MDVKTTISDLPEGCLSHILSFTSPRDACRSSLLSSGFRSAALLDMLWSKFLPSDCEEIISTAASPMVFSSKKDLYFRLCDTPILIDGVNKTFALERENGKKCYMIGARDLSIAWKDSPAYWRWTSSPDSRFPEVAQLRAVCWLDIRGNIETRLLSPNTTYAAYFVFKIGSRSSGLEFTPVTASVKCIWDGGYAVVKTAFLKARESASVHRQEEEEEGEIPRERGDGWMEIEMGSYFNDGGDGGEMEMEIKEVDDLNWKSGLIVQGIEIRPRVGE